MSRDKTSWATFVDSHTIVPPLTDRGILIREPTDEEKRRLNLLPVVYDDEPYHGVEFKAVETYSIDDGYIRVSYELVPSGDSSFPSYAPEETPDSNSFPSETGGVFPDFES